MHYNCYSTYLATSLSIYIGVDPLAHRVRSHQRPPPAPSDRHARNGNGRLLVVSSLRRRGRVASSWFDEEEDEHADDEEDEKEEDFAFYGAALVVCCLVVEYTWLVTCGWRWVVLKRSWGTVGDEHTVFNSLSAA